MQAPSNPAIRWIFLVPAFFACLAVSRPAFPQASVNVSPLDSVYRDIDKLVANDLIDRIIAGQKPYSRKEIARLTAEAMFHLDRLKKPLADPQTPEKKKRKLQARLDYVNRILSRLQADYREELVQLKALEGKSEWYSAHPIEKIETGMIVTNSPAEALPVNNGVADIDAVINPLVDYRQGRHIVDGATMFLETTHWVRATDHFALYFRPRFQLGIARDGQPDENRADVLNLYGKFYVKNFELEIGRDNLFWGQGKDAGIQLSNNPRGLDMAKISNDSPFFFPWVFRYIGANKMTFFFANLGPEQNFPYAYLAGYKWSLEPLRFIEVGASVTVQSGGDGSPPASFGDRVADMFPFIEGSSNQISNIFAGLDFRFRIPPARGLELYAEAYFDDQNSEFDLQFIDDAAYIVGIYLPRVDQAGQIDLRLELQYTGIRFYRHGQFTSGYTLNQFILGNNLGPDAYGGYATVGWELNRNHTFYFNAAFENRSADIYQAVLGPNSTPESADIIAFDKIVDNPDERRYRLTSTWVHRIETMPVQLTVGLGYERVQNFAFTAGNDRNNFLGEVGIQIQLDKWTSFPRNKTQKN